MQRYPLTAWQPQFRHIRTDLDDALKREADLAVVEPDPGQRRYLTDSFRQFWNSVDRVFEIAANGKPEEERIQILNSLQAREAEFSADVARLLVANNASEQQAALRTRDLYTRVEKNVYLFLAAMLVVVVITGLYLAQHVRRLFLQVADISEQWLALAEQRRELAQQLIASQENTFRSIARELHDEFGQILTAVGAILQRADRRAARENIAPTEDLREVREIVQDAFEKVRSLSQALHPAVLDEAGLESALAAYLPGFEQRTGIVIEYATSGTNRVLDKEVSIHLYRVVQEALSNVVRHSKSPTASVRLRFSEAAVVVEVEDEGTQWISERARRHGLGLVSMRERADLISGTIEFLRGKAGGALVRATAISYREVEVHATD